MRLNPVNRSTKGVCRSDSLVAFSGGFGGHQVAKLRAKLSATSLSRKEENVGATRRLRLIAGQAEGLKAELAESKAETAEKGRQLTRYRNEVGDLM